MSTPRRQRQREKFAWKKYAFWALAVVPVLLVVGYFVARAWVDRYLRSDDFRRFVSRATARTLKAEGEFAPLHFTGMNIYSDGFKARGSEQAAFAALAIDQIHAELSLRRWGERVWQVEQIEAQRVEVRLDGSRIALEQTPAAPASQAPVALPSGGGWLPNRVEVARAVVREATLLWGDSGEGAGSVRNVRLAATQRDGAWEITGNGGRIEQHGLPALDVVGLNVVYKAPSLFVQRAEFRQGATGSVNAEGEVRFGDQLDLRAKLAGIDIAPFLSKDWRVRMHGKLAGEVRVQGSLPSSDPPVVSGSLQLSEGQLEALPVLDEIAAFTRLQQYRRIVLSKASADFRQEGGTLRATNFVAESAGLIRIEGAFSVINRTIDGTFQVGVTSSSLQWLPGSQERVFTEARAGYMWTPMRLSGPLERPGEDLSPRLIAAAEGAVIEKVGATVQSAVETGKEVIETGKGVIKGALDRLMPLFK